MLALLCLGGGCGTSGGSGTRASSRPRKNPGLPAPDIGAFLRVGDSLNVALQSIPDPQSIPAQIDDEGYITLQYIGRLKAAGLTPSELAKSIQETYLAKKIYRAIDVSVSLGERYVYVDGEVIRRGRVLWTPDMTITKALAAAGGFSLYAKETAVVLSREGRSYTINVKLAQKQPPEDMPMLPGDRVLVPRSAF